MVYRIHVVFIMIDTYRETVDTYLQDLVKVGQLQCAFCSPNNLPFYFKNLSYYVFMSVCMICFTLLSSICVHCFLFLLLLVSLFVDSKMFSMHISQHKLKHKFI